jgi:hypothetical protein
MVTALALAAFGLAGCGTVKVFPASSGFKAERRPPDCQVQFLLRPPQQPYDEIADLVRYLPGAESTETYPGGTEPQDVLRQKACELGADAVIITRDMLIPSLEGADAKLVAGIAVKYRSAAGGGTTGQPPS